MALTPTEEGQIRDILVNFDGVLDISQASSAILAALGYGDVMVTALPDASTLTADDVLYVAQSGADVKAKIQQIAEYVSTLISGTVTSVNGQDGAVILKSIDGVSLSGAGDIATAPFSNSTSLAQAHAIALYF